MAQPERLSGYNPRFWTQVQKELQQLPKAPAPKGNWKPLDPAPGMSAPPLAKPKD